MKLLVTGGSGFIGTHLVALALEHGVDVLNVDLVPPRDPTHAALWRRVDVLDRQSLVNLSRSFSPVWVAHLAAYTGTEKTAKLQDYAASTTGTANVLEAVRRSASVQRFIDTSTQFVCRPGVAPASDETFEPHTVYGWSKVIGEQLTRHAGLGAAWTIVRPTTIWGPRSPTHPGRMVEAMKRGLYLHPRRNCLRGYGYVKNVVFQLLAILRAPRERVDGKVFYVGDRMIELHAWVDAFSRKATGRPARTIPLPLMKAIARVGDALTIVRGEPFLIQSTRLSSMIEDYSVPMQPIFDLAGEPPYSLDRAMDESLAWLTSAGA